MKKHFVVGFLVLGIVAVTSAAALVVRANENIGNRFSGSIKAVEAFIERLEKFEDKDFRFGVKAFEQGVTPTTLMINPRGHARITRGTVTAVSLDRITVAVWNLQFSIVNASSTLFFA